MDKKDESRDKAPERLNETAQSRRDFLKRGAAAGLGAAALMAPGQALAQKSAGTDDIVWDYEVDVVVLGAGCMGLPSAIRARDLGATVMVVEQNFDCGGRMLHSAGQISMGGGDPLLSSDWYPESNLERFPVTSPTSLDTLADRVVAAGVTTITGGVVGDGSRYDDEFYAPGWGVGVPGLEGGPYDALMANDSRVLGEELRASDPNSAAAREFARLLGERGVTIAGGSSSGAAPSGAVEIASIESAPMSDVVAEMLGNSDNNTAELVVKELGVVDGVVGTREAGLAVMREQLVEWAVDVEQVVLADGSGLSLDNRLTCGALGAVVERYDSDSAIGRALPVAAQTGTLTDVFADHPVAGRLLGKTGTLNNPPFNVDPPAVKALAGYLPVEGGGDVEYVLVLNGPTISDQSEYRPIWTQLADTLDTYPSGPGPAELGPR